VGMVILGVPGGAFPKEVAGLPPLEVGAAAVAGPLFSEFLLPFEAVSMLLLAAIVGSVALTKRRLS